MSRTLEVIDIPNLKEVPATERGEYVKRMKAHRMAVG